MNFSINVKPRTENAEQTRSKGLVPAVLYGPESKSESVAVDYLTFEKLYQEAGESNLVDLTVEGSNNSSKVLIQEVQKDPVKDNFIHIDFMQINMKKEMHAAVPINYIGESAAVKELGGTLIKGPQTLNIKCLPNDLVGSINLDLSVLKTFDDVVKIGDIVLPEGIVVTDNLNTVAAKVAPPLTEEQLAAMEKTTQVDVSGVEVEGAKAVEGAEGESPAEESKDGKKADEGEKKEEAK